MSVARPIVVRLHRACSSLISHSAMFHAHFVAAGGFCASIMSRWLQSFAARYIAIPFLVGRFSLLPIPSLAHIYLLLTSNGNLLSRNLNGPSRCCLHPPPKQIYHPLSPSLVRLHHRCRLLQPGGSPRLRHICKGVPHPLSDLRRPGMGAYRPHACVPHPVVSKWVRTAHGCVPYPVVSKCVRTAPCQEICRTHPLELSGLRPCLDAAP